MSNTCCNNKTLAYRSENDQALVKKYCAYALSAPTNPFKNYSTKEFFCTGCGDSSASQYYSLQGAYQFHPGTMASCGTR